MAKLTRAKFDAMTRAEKLAHFATANRVTVGTITQVQDRELKRFYVAKVRGMIVGDTDNYRHETHEAARKAGWEMLNYWKKEYSEAQS